MDAKWKMTVCNAFSKISAYKHQYGGRREKFPIKDSGNAKSRWRVCLQKMFSQSRSLLIGCSSVMPPRLLLKPPLQTCQQTPKQTWTLCVCVCVQVTLHITWMSCGRFIHFKSTKLKPVLTAGVFLLEFTCHCVNVKEKHSWHFTQWSFYFTQICTPTTNSS